MTSEEKRLVRAENNLLKFLRSINKRQTFKVFWEIRRIQSKFGSKPWAIKNLPNGGLGRTIGDKAHIPPWSIEQFLNCVAIYSNDKSKLDMTEWNNIAHLYNLFREYNDARSGVFLRDNDVFVSLSKNTYSQFPWQDGSTGTEALSRYAYLYCGEVCNEASQKQFGISTSDFFAYGFLIASLFFKSPYIQLPCNLDKIAGDAIKLKTVLDRFSCKFQSLRSDTRHVRRSDHLGEHSKSLFRDTPIIKIHHSKYFCPFPELLIFRITSGLITEISGNDGKVRSEVGGRFESHCEKIFTSAFPKIEVKPEEIYGSKKAPKNTPDLRLYEKEELKVIVECKATKLNFDSKFQLNNLEDFPDRSDEIIKGIVQIWNYIALTKKEKTPDKKINRNLFGIVLTLDTWVQMEKDRFQNFIDAAHRIADSKSVPGDCRVKILITPITNIEFISQRCDWSQFVNCLSLSQDKKFNGYILFNVFKALYPNAKIQNKYDFDETLNDNIWFWGKVKDLKSTNKILG